jgi:Tfp pilus assembly protein PilV
MLRMAVMSIHRLRNRASVAGVTLVELMVSVSVLAMGVAALVGMNSYVLSTLRRSTHASFASQLIQERMEQFRRIAWTQITSNYPPSDDDPTSDGYDTDADGDPYVEETYPTEFPYNASELDALTPGMLTVMATATASETQLNGVVENVKVETYNASSAPIKVFDWDGTQIEIAAFSVGGRPIEVERANGVVTTKSHNAMVVLSTTVRLTLTVRWTGSNGVQRKKETVTLFTVEGDK